jgi:hypothetical protein
VNERPTLAARAKPGVAESRESGSGIQIAHPKKGEKTLSEQKMGTHYVREICQHFNEVAEQTSLAGLKETLTGLADQLEPLATKLFFKTQKGNEDMQKAAAEVEGMKAKLAAAQDQAEADALIGPLAETLEKTIKHVKTMKVRMT